MPIPVTAADVAKKCGEYLEAHWQVEKVIRTLKNAKCEEEKTRLVHASQIGITFRNAIGQELREMLK